MVLVLVIVFVVGALINELYATVALMILSQLCQIVIIFGVPKQDELIVGSFSLLFMSLRSAVVIFGSVYLTKLAFRHENKYSILSAAFGISNFHLILAGMIKPYLKKYYGNTFTFISSVSSSLVC